MIAQPIDISVPGGAGTAPSSNTVSSIVDNDDNEGAAAELDDSPGVTDIAATTQAAIAAGETPDAGVMLADADDPNDVDVCDDDDIDTPAFPPL